MITGGFKQAYDELSAAVRTIWLADAVTLSYDLRFEDVSDDVDDAPETGEAAFAKPWALFSVRTGDSPQTGFGSSGCSQYTTTGIGTVQIFTPRGDGQELAHEIGKILQDGLRGLQTSPGQVIVRRPVLRPIGNDGLWFQTNVEFDFTFYEVS